MHTIDEIQAHFPNLPVHDIWINPKMYYLKIAKYNDAEYMYLTGRISSEYWEAYCVIWRNLTYHYSSIAIQYEF